MDLLSGILLTGIVLFVVVLLIKEIFGERVASSLASRSEESKPVNEHLIGTVGKVVDSSEGSDGLIKVRIGIERWKAKLNSTDSRPLPVGAEVRVTAVNGLVLDVEECDPKPLSRS